MLSVSFECRFLYFVHDMLILTERHFGNSFLQIISQRQGFF